MAVMMAYYFGWEFVVILFVTVAFYIWFTIKASEVAHRHPA